MFVLTLFVPFCKCKLTNETGLIPLDFKIFDGNFLCLVDKKNETKSMIIGGC